MAEEADSPVGSSGSVEESAEGEDYVFRFSLTAPAADEQCYSDPLLELIRGQLADLLDAVVLTCKGEEVKVNGFRLMQDPETCYEIFPRHSRDE